MLITSLQYEQAKSEVGGIEKFIAESIRDYRLTDKYRNTEIAKRYFAGQTDIINRKKQYVNEQGRLVTDNYKANNRIGTDIFKKIVLQENSTLLSNGVNIDSEIKKRFAKQFDIKLQRLGVETSLGGTAYGYVYPSRRGFNLEVFGADEFVPVVDAFSGSLVAGIRFIQLDLSLPTKAEFYEMDGLTEYIINGDEVKLHKEKTPYLSKIKSSAVYKETVTSNYSMLPVIPLHSGILKQSRLNFALKSKIDLLEVIMSDFGNNLEDMQDVYWIVKNYDGQDLGQFLGELKKYKTLRVQDDGDVKSQTTEVPYQAREIAIKMLKKQIFSDAMALDTEDMTGTLTTVEINARRENLNLKVDDFENEVHEFMDNVMLIFQEIYGEVEEYDISFDRSGLMNKTEIIDNINKIRADIDHRTALEMNPMVDNDMIDVILERYKEENEMMLVEELELEDEAKIEEDKIKEDIGEELNKEV